MRYFFQVYVGHRWDGWPTQWSGESKEEAVQRAETFHRETGRPVRVIDDDEQKIWLSPESIKAFKRRTGYVSG